jgi:circadian clock protein KaiB
MSRTKTKRIASSPAVATIVVMRLYIANDAPNSLRAVANLVAICNEHLQHKFKLEIIDVLESPLRAVTDGILVTPSLAKVSPSPVVKVVGDLSDKSSVLDALGIGESVE